MSGTLVRGWTDSGWAWPKPGRKNIAGETLPDVLMPLQPLPSNPSTETSAIINHFQSNLTGRTISTVKSKATTNSGRLATLASLAALMMFSFGLMIANFTALAMEPQGHNAGMASSVVGALSTAIGALAGGLVARAFDGSVLPIAAGFAICSIIAGLIVFRVEGTSGLFGANRPA